MDGAPPPRWLAHREMQGGPVIVPSSFGVYILRVALLDLASSIFYDMPMLKHRVSRCIRHCQDGICLTAYTIYQGFFPDIEAAMLGKGKNFLVRILLDRQMTIKSAAKGTKTAIKSIETW